MVTKPGHVCFSARPPVRHLLPGAGAAKKGQFFGIWTIHKKEKKERKKREKKRKKRKKRGKNAARSAARRRRAWRAAGADNTYQGPINVTIFSPMWVRSGRGGGVWVGGMVTAWSVGALVPLEISHVHRAR